MIAAQKKCNVVNLIWQSWTCHADIFTTKCILCPFLLQKHTIRPYFSFYMNTHFCKGIWKDRNDWYPRSCKCISVPENSKFRGISNDTCRLIIPISTSLKSKLHLLIPYMLVFLSNALYHTVIPQQTGYQTPGHFNLGLQARLDSNQLLQDKTDFPAFWGLESVCSNFELFLLGRRKQSEAKLKAPGDKHCDRNG